MNSFSVLDLEVHPGVYFHWLLTLLKSGAPEIPTVVELRVHPCFCSSVARMQNCQGEPWLL